MTEVLDTYAGGMASVQQRPDAIATISAGYKEKVAGQSYERPVVSRDRKIILHDPDNSAPGLKAALEATDYLRLTIAFPVEDESLFIQSRFVKYSATRLELYGDENSLTIIEKGGKRTEVSASDKRYAEILKSDPAIKVSTSVYFTLARWEDDGRTSVVFADGFGLYRLRFTSRNSLRQFHAQVATIRQFTGGRIAGVPLDLFIQNRDVMGPDGSRRTVPMFCLRVKPPAAIALSSNNFRRIIGGALEQGELLSLPGPQPQSLDTALADEPDIDLDALDVLEDGGRCDEAHWRRAWHAVVQGTDFADEAARHEFVRRYTQGRTESLTGFLRDASEDAAADLINAVSEAIREAKDSVIEKLRECALALTDDPKRIEMIKRAKTEERLHNMLAVLEAKAERETAK